MASSPSYRTSPWRSPEAIFGHFQKEKRYLSQLIVFRGQFSVETGHVTEEDVVGQDFGRRTVQDLVHLCEEEGRRDDDRPILNVTMDTLGCDGPEELSPVYLEEHGEKSWMG